MAQVDDLRRDPVRTIGEWFTPMAPSSPDRMAVADGMTAQAGGTSGSPRRGKEMPAAVKALTWMFATGRHSAMFRRRKAFGA